MATTDHGWAQNTPEAQRSNSDRPDDVVGSQVHVMYVLASDSDDERLDTNGTIAMSIAAAQGWFALRSGGRRLRFDTAGGKLDITFRRLSQSQDELAAHGLFMREAIEAGLRREGFDARDKIYLVYYGGKGPTCGGGSWPPTVRGSVTALYLHGTPPGAPPCRSNAFARTADHVGYWETAALHETLHSLGAVATCAPNHTRAGHVSDDPRDLMYAGDKPWRPTMIDVGRDDYFDHGRTGCLDIADSPYLSPRGERAPEPK